MSQSTNKRVDPRRRNSIQIVIGLILCLVLTLMVLFAAFPNFKATVLNSILDVYEDNKSEAIAGTLEVSDEFSFMPLWLPDGCVLIQEEELIDSYYQYYENNSGSSVFIQKILAEDQVITLDTENAEVEEITVQGCNGTMITKNSACQIIWLDPQQNMCFIVATEGFAVQDTLQIAENLEV